MTDAEARARVVEEARSWLGTPYHSQARIKGVGVDCLTLLLRVYENAGVMAHFDPGYYNPEFHLHRDEPLYLNGVLRFTREVAREEVLPGDVVLFKFGRTLSHGGIVIEWPMVMHAFLGRPVCIDNVDMTAWLNTVGENQVGDRGKPRQMRFFRPNQWS